MVICGIYFITLLDVHRENRIRNSLELLSDACISDFDIASDENAGSDYGRLEAGAKFIDDTDLDSTDVAQGKI